MIHLARISNLDATKMQVKGTEPSY